MTATIRQNRNQAHAPDTHTAHRDISVGRPGALDAAGACRLAYEAALSCSSDCCGCCGCESLLPIVATPNTAYGRCDCWAMLMAMSPQWSRSSMWPAWFPSATTPTRRCTPGNSETCSEI